MADRREKLDGPYFTFTYLWSGQYPTQYTLDLSGSGCVQKLGWDRVGVTHILDRGNIKRYHKGWRLKVSLTWGGKEAVIKRTYDSDTTPGKTEKLINLLYNISCNEQCFFYPYPSLHPSKYFDVMIAGDFNLQYVKGLEGTGYQGSMSLTGKTIFHEVPMIGIYGSTTP